MKVGEKIKKIRELKNFTQGYMAEQLELAQSSYSKIESGEIDLTISRIEQIAKILYIDISQILNFDSKQFFFVSNNNFVKESGAKAENINFFGNDYKEKYIKILEEEVDRLKKIIDNKFT